VAVHMTPMHHDLLGLAADIRLNHSGLPPACYMHCDYMLGKMPAVIFCKTDFLGRLFYFMRKLDVQHPVVLVTGNSDFHINSADRPACVKKWYAENLHVEDPDVYPLPLGLERPGVGRSYRPDLWVPESGIRFDRAIVCHGDGTHEIRPKVREAYSDKPWVKVFPTDTPIETYAEALKTHKYIFCPPGNGADTHRVWEALHCGCIPIMQASIMSKYWVKELGLPIFLTDDLLSVTKEQLDFADIRYRGPYAPLFAEYWIDLFKKELEWLTP